MFGKKKIATAHFHEKIRNFFNKKKIMIFIIFSAAFREQQVTKLKHKYNFFFQILFWVSFERTEIKNRIYFFSSQMI